MKTDDMNSDDMNSGGKDSGGKDTGTSPASLPRWYAEDVRPRWYAGVIVGSATVLIALVLTAVLVDDAPQTLLGFFTGALGTLLLATVSWIEYGHRDAARRRDAAALDDLEPLRAASAADRADER